MHELSIALSILDLAAEEAQRRGNPRVEAIHLRLGPLAGVARESLLSAYELARESTPLADCSLVIEDIPLVIFCPGCQAERRAVSVQELACEICGTPAARVIRGRELEVSAMEICE